MAICTVLAVSLIVASGPGYALIGNTFFGSDILTAEDIQMQRAAGLELLKNGKEGDSAEWTNPSTKSFGTITLREKLNHNDYECRKVELVNTPKGDEIQRVWLQHVVCNVPGQGWKYLY
ncbi:hypothetical protein [Nisaea sp.]|uniref:hypothetical protein n=1 Tax=Nisaea sp. TaxID=2024842 RepID=UPI003B51948F